MHDTDDLIAEFLTESRDSLAWLERELTALASGTHDPERIADIFRVVHTLKGSCGFLGFSRLEAVAHVSETLLSRVGDGDVRFDDAIASALRSVIGAVKATLCHIEDSGTEGPGDPDGLIAQLTALHACAPGPAAAGRRADMGGGGPEAGVPRAVQRAPTDDPAGQPQPIGTVWDRFQRTVRDFASRCGKQVRVEMEGHETVVDRAVLEVLKAPLTHLLRNAIAHGIETPAARRAAGKPPEGVIRLRACRTSSRVVMEVADDGQGVDAARLRERALARGLITHEQSARLADRAMLALVFVPGLSTADGVTHVSGRGVGMDVVRTDVERIGGRVDITSAAGVGTTLRITIPVSPTRRRTPSASSNRPRQGSARAARTTVPDPMRPTAV